MNICQGMVFRYLTLGASYETSGLLAQWVETPMTLPHWMETDTSSRSRGFRTFITARVPR